MVEICTDLKMYVRNKPHCRKVFLMDGDALVLPQSKLYPLCHRINSTVPSLRRISAYANAESIVDRDETELRCLSDSGLTLVYMGLESGCQQVLNLRKKKSYVEQMIAAVIKAKACGIETSLMVLIGLGGQSLSAAHSIQTAEAVNRMQPRYLNFLSLMLIPGTKLFAEYTEGHFIPLDTQGFLIESYEIIKNLELRNCLFFSNHASNYLPIHTRLPQGKNTLLRTFERAITGKYNITPDSMRRL